MILPEEVLARMKVGEGEQIVLAETPAGFAMTPYDPAFMEQMDAAEEIMRQRRHLLRALAE